MGQESGRYKEEGDKKENCSGEGEEKNSTDAAGVTGDTS